VVYKELRMRNLYGIKNLSERDFEKLQDAKEVENKM
jgi:hypothetical protein